MVLNKKGWHKFMSICLCIAVLCITNKHSLLPSAMGKGHRKAAHRTKALAQGSSAQEKGLRVALRASPGLLCFCHHLL